MYLMSLTRTRRRHYLGYQNTGTSLHSLKGQLALGVEIVGIVIVQLLMLCGGGRSIIPKLPKVPFTIFCFSLQ